MSTYNGHKYLDKQLKSIAEQTVVNHLTLYIRDDGSKDDTFDIIDKWKNKINIVLYKEKNAGPAMSFWQLLMKSEVKADYYAFCDQDDVWDKDKIEKGIEKGRREEKFETARNLKSLGMTSEQIMQVTGLSLTEIESL